MKVLIVGGAGFIGANISKRLLNIGEEVICLDNLSTGSKENILEFIYNPKYTFVLHDITEPFPAANVDVIINCCLPPIKDPAHFFKVCSYGTFNIGGMARRNNARVINIIKEFSYTDERWLHGIKTINYILDTYKQFETRHILLGNLYGEKMSSNNRLYKMIHRIIQGKDIEVSSEKLDYCHINDALDAIRCAISSPDYCDYVQGGEFISEECLAKKIINLTNSKTLIYSKEYSAKPKIYEWNKRWKCKVKISENLQEMINYVKKNL